MKASISLCPHDLEVIDVLKAMLDITLEKGKLISFVEFDCWRNALNISGWGEQEFFTFFNKHREYGTFLHLIIKVFVIIIILKFDYLF